MRRKSFSRIVLILIMMIGMMISALPVRVHAEGETDAWTKVSFDEISDGDVIAVTMSKDDNTWILPNAATGRTPAADTATVSGDVLTADPDTHGWTFKKADGGYTIGNENGYLNPGTANNGLRANGESAVWTFDSGYLKEITTGRYMGVYSSNNTPVDFRTYTNTTGNIAGQTLALWKLGESVPAAVKAPKADIASGEVEKGTVVTFTSATEGAEIYLSANSGEWEKVSTYTVEEAVTISAKAVLGEEESKVVTFKYTVKIPEEEKIKLGKLIGAPEDGDHVVIYHPKSKMVMTAAASGKKLAGTAAEMNNDLITKTDDMAYLTVSVSDSQYVFELNGSYLTSGETGSSLTFAADKTSDLAKWTLEQQTDGTWYLMNVGANYNGNHNQALEYYSGFTTYGVKTDNADYKFEFYNEESADNVPAPTADVAAGEVEKGTVVTFTCSAEGAEVYLSTDGETWTKVSTYTITEDVTISAKAVLGEKESAVAVFKYTVKPEVVEIKTIAEVLAGDTGTSFTVKGVVTLVDGKNIYIQDETGGICLFFDAAPGDIQLGDTLIGTGSRADFKGLPELSGATAEKSEGLTLSAKETTIAALTTADVCTYIKLTDLEVTEVYDNNGAYSSPNIKVKDSDGNEIQIYKAVIGKTDGVWDVAVGDTVDVNAAVGINNTTLQLRNTKAEEITRKGAEDEVAAPTADVAAGEVEKGTVVTFTSATEGAEIYLCTDGETWEKVNTYTIEADVRISAKAVLGDKESAVAVFKYTVKPEVVEIKTIEEALAGAEGTSFTVKGVVTLVDGKNIYIQDATGGICLYFNAAPSDIQLGDTLIGTGNRAVYRGLPELSAATAEKSEGLILNAKETTIAALTAADVCTYVKLTGLEVTEVYDNNGAYSTPNIKVKDSDGNEIQIYKAVVNKTDGVWEYAVGDVIDVNAAVGINNTTLQLRNTKAEEIKKHGDEDPYADIDAKYSVYLKTAELKAGDKVVIYNAGSGNGVKGILKSSYYLEGEALTPAEDIIASDVDEVEWTVGINEDGTYTFTQGEKMLAGKQTNNGTKTYNNITLSSEDNTAWQLTECNAENGSWYISNPAMESAYEGGKVYLEWYARYTEFSLYDAATVSEENFGYTFYKLVREKTEPVGPVDDGDLVTDLSLLKDGSYVVIYNPYNKVAMSSETYQDWFLLASDVTIEENKVVNPDAKQIWKVSVSEDGVYTFTQESKAVAVWLDGTYVELTNNPSYNEETSISWKLKECNADNSTYYIYSSDLTTSYGNCYIEAYYKKQVEGTAFCGYSTSEDKLSESAYGMQFYLTEYKEPEDKGDLVQDLSELTDGKEVVIYSPGHKTAISSKPNGDWYLKAVNTRIANNKVALFTEDLVWTVKVNEDGTYSFYAYGDETRSITVWPSGTYAELSVDVGKYPDNTWTLTPAKTADCFYINSPTISAANGPAYIEAYVRNGTEVYSGYFTSPSNSRFTENEFALQFYLVNGEDAVPPFDDGEWDGVLNKGEQYVIHNIAAESTIGLLDEANYSMKAIPSVVEDGKTAGGNGTYVFTVDSMGKYYTFMTNGKYLATNNSEELLLIDPTEDGKAPETAKWFLTEKEGTAADGTVQTGYIIYNKEANYNGTPVCIEYFSSVFSGWTFSTKNDIEIYLFNFYKLTDDAVVYKDIVQDPSILFDCKDFRYVEQDYKAEFSLDDLADAIEKVTITYTAGSRTGEVTEYTGNERNYSFVIPAGEIDVEDGLESFTIKVDVTNSYGLSYSEEKVITIIDEPFFEDEKPAANSQTGEEKRPEISVKIGNAGENPETSLFIGSDKVDAVFENGILSYTPEEDLEDGFVDVLASVTRADGKSAGMSWIFTVGYNDYQLYYGQLHSHTTYSDGSGSLDTALEYVSSLPESANVDFVAFTDHSNYFDSTSNANPADAMNDASLMNSASAALWNEYKSKVAAFNEKQKDIIAIAGYEMTWAGGPGHINSFNTQGIVSRNNADLNNKTNDAGMKLYYETMKKDNGETMHQFNHPGNTFGNFTDFGYWDEQTDDHIFLVEVGNGEGQIGEGGYYPSYEQYILALDKGWHVAPTNNQDNHKGRWGNANDARDVVLTNDFSETGIYDAIRNRRIYATEDKNLSIHYTLNDYVMGSIVSGDDEIDKLNILVTLYDPDSSDSIEKVEVVCNSGKVAYTWDDPDVIAEGRLTAELDPQYTYYFIRVTQKDGDLAVTAPVWLPKSTKLGIESVTAPEIALVNQEITLNTVLFNEEYADATLKSLIYTVDGSKVIGTDTTARTIKGESTLEVPFTFTMDTAKRITVTVTAVIEYEGIELELSKDAIIKVREQEGDLPVSAIKDVQAVNEKGFEFAIEGIVTSNASGYDKDTAFFDCIYVQDETGGICCFPVSGEYKIGDKVHIEGYTDFYQGEPELQVESIEVIGEGTIEPETVTAEQINNLSVLGKLVTLKGTVESVEMANDLVLAILVKDEAGNIARVFIDGYITSGYDVENCVEGASISATGLASYDDTWADTDYFARIRIRDRKDVICQTGFTIDPKTAEMATETTLQLNASGKVAFWTSSDEEIATVDETGLVKALRYGKVTITAVSADNPNFTDTCEIQTRFYDVNDPKKYYYTPVYWAADNEITTGYDRVYFGPQKNCTRQELAIFLWRLAGKPAVSGTLPFSDTKYDESSASFQAILWCSQQGIVKGYSDGTFKPKANVERKDAMIMLYRLAGKPEVTGEIKFPDVVKMKLSKTSDTYKAILWGVNNGITNGYKDGNFQPKTKCLREHIVTFIYRADKVINQ